MARHDAPSDDVRQHLGEARGVRDGVLGGRAVRMDGLLLCSAGAHSVNTPSATAVVWQRIADLAPSDGCPGSTVLERLIKRVRSHVADDGRREWIASDILAAGRGRSSSPTGAYNSDRLRADIAARGGWANVRPVTRRKRTLAFSPFLYRTRNLVERSFNYIKHMRAIATRFEKDPANFLALVTLAAIRLWLRRIGSVS